MYGFENAEENLEFGATAESRSRYLDNVSVHKAVALPDVECGNADSEDSTTTNTNKVADIPTENLIEAVPAETINETSAAEPLTEAGIATPADKNEIDFDAIVFPDIDEALELFGA